MARKRKRNIWILLGVIGLGVFFYTKASSSLVPVG